MPKIRGIKPETWTDENFVDLSPFARLLFIGLWNYACDNGHLEDRSKQIKMRILPADDVNVAELLRELDEKGRIVRSEGWITIPNLPEHQRIDKRFFTTCDKEGCERPGANPERETRRVPDENTTGTRMAHASTPGDCDGDVDGDGELMVKGAAASKSRKKPSTRLPADWTPSDEHATRATQDGIDLHGQAARFRAHAEANDRRQANWNAAFTQWLLNVPEWQRNQRPAQVRHLPKAHEIERPPDGLSPEQYAAWEREQRERRRA